MKRWRFLYRGLRAVSQSRLFVRSSSSSPTISTIDDLIESEPVLEVTPLRGVEREELLALDRKFEKILRGDRERFLKRPLRNDSLEP